MFFASQFAATSYFWSLPTCWMVAFFGKAAAGTKLNPARVCCRYKCFMCTVSPARTSVRSNTVVAM